MKDTKKGRLRQAREKDAVLCAPHKTGMEAEDDFSEILRELKNNPPPPYIRQRCFCWQAGHLELECTSYSHCSRMLRKEVSIWEQR